ncbi:MAG: tRNA (guanine(10)-N(2))-dimethyltransferase [Promethearchaeota archaeon]|jgi:tRNA (guanine26-N2/guanine27-N2)-dimethyltransferase
MMKKNEKVRSFEFSIKKEGLSKFYIPTANELSIPSKSMVVFYNKKMEINRDISNLAIVAYSNIFNQKSLIIVDSMAASGISSIRMLKECKNIEKIYINDINPIAVNIIHQNLSLNKLKNQPIQMEVSGKDASFLFSEIAQKYYSNSEDCHRKPNIISIDPFGTPSLYLDTAFKAIKKVNGLLCITATDTPVLFGIRPKSCIRKYMSKPLHTEYCKEIGARILIHFLSRIANINKMGVIPLLTFYNSHFIRVFCLTFKNKAKISQFFKSYGYIIHCYNCGYRSVIQDNILEVINKCPVCTENDKFEFAGPLWVDEIHNIKFIEEMIVLNEKLHYNNKKRINKLLNLAKEEVTMPLSYYNVHKLCKTLKISAIPKLDTLINHIKKRGYNISRTHFDFLSIKTNMDMEMIKKALLELQTN